MKPTTHHYIVFETALGFSAVAWHDTVITRFQLPSSTAESAERNMLRRLPAAELSTPPREVADVIEAAKRYFQGEKIDFSGVAIDLADQDEFFQQIYAHTRKVGWGQTTTYGALAKEAGAGREGARNVGQAMAKNPVPLLIPCHRVLAAGGKTGGFSAPGGVDTKLRMLTLEGVDPSGGAAAQQSLGL